MTTSPHLLSHSTSPDIGIEFAECKPLHASQLTDEYRNSRHYREGAFSSSSWMDASADIDMYGWVADSSHLSVTSVQSRSTPPNSPNQSPVPDCIWPPSPFFGPEIRVLTAPDEFELLLQTAISWGFDEIPPRLIMFIHNATPNIRTVIHNLISGNAIYANSPYGQQIADAIAHTNTNTNTPPVTSGDDMPLEIITRDDKGTPPKDKKEINESEYKPDISTGMSTADTPGANSPLVFSRSAAVRLTLLSISRGTLDPQFNPHGFWPSETQLFCVAAIDADRYDYFNQLWTEYSMSFDRSNVRNICIRAVQHACPSEYIARILASERDRVYVANDAYLWATVAARGNVDNVSRTPPDMVPLSCAAAAKAGNVECLRLLTDMVRYNRTEIMSCGTVCAAAASGNHQECLALALSLGWTMDAQTSLAAAAHGHLVCLQYAIVMGCPWHEDAMLRAAQV